MTSETNSIKIAREIAKPFEGLFLKPYHDPVGYPTVGYGHLLSYQKWADLSQWSAVTQEEADRLLELDLIKARRGVLYNVKVPLNPNQEAALIDFAFNLGIGNLRISTLLKMLNRGEYESASGQFMRWNKAGGKVYRGLTRRRTAERFKFDQAMFDYIDC